MNNEISKIINFDRGDNTSYSDLDILDHMLDCNLVGKHRFSHYNDLANDPGYKRIKAKDYLPDESICCKFLDKIKDQNITELKEVMNTLLEKKSQLDGPHEAWLSIDDSVSVLYGNQENNLYRL